MTFIAEQQGVYSVKGTVTSEQILAMAQNLVEEDFERGASITSTDDAKKHLQILMAPLKQEVFALLFMDAQHRIIRFEKLFFGTIRLVSVFPREVVRKAMEYNAACLIAVHNHPSGSPQPSKEDINMTVRLKDALALIDVNLLDHVVVGAEGTVSMAEDNLI